jgi:hypothetical protein
MESWTGALGEAEAYKHMIIAIYVLFVVLSSARHLGQTRYDLSTCTLLPTVKK